jgi:hypothetical protein
MARKELVAGHRRQCTITIGATSRLVISVASELGAPVGFSNRNTNELATCNAYQFYNAWVLLEITHMARQMALNKSSAIKRRSLIHALE